MITIFMIHFAAVAVVLLPPVSAMALPTTPLPPKSGVDFEALPWNMNLPDEVSYIHLKTSGEWTAEHYDPESDSGSLFEAVNKYSNPSGLGLRPACTSLNYGTTIWEGLKCMRLQDGTPVVFRPDRNYERFARGAEQMCLPIPSRDLFMRGIQHILHENSHVIPPHGDGMKLYIRPMLFGSGQQLGLYPSAEFSLLFYVSPTVSIGESWVCLLTWLSENAFSSKSSGELFQECQWRLEHSSGNQTFSRFPRRRWER
jgi:branched-chain amino acid aminotransferase